MSTVKAGAGRRVAALAYTLVTTAIVLMLALAEWATEKEVAEHSRVASTAIEIAVVLIAALVFRPIHQFIESRVESLFYARKHHALASLKKLRHEFASFADARQLLRRTIEAIDHYLEARGTAVYLRRDVYRAEASSFDIPLELVDLDDPLAIRFHASAAPARPSQLKSRAHGSDAFALTAAGELIGFLTSDARHGSFDHEEAEMLSGLAQDLAVALVSLDPELRPTNRAIPNNLPADLTPIVGRERELREIEAALAEARLVTVTGPGGVGKTRVALRAAIETMDEHEHGAWFVNLSPITDPHLVAATIASAFDLKIGDSANALDVLCEFLRKRHALLLVDNCEHVIAEVTNVAVRLLAQCSHVKILTTSRELLHLDGEQVYRLGPLDKGTSVALFAQRAAAMVPQFEWHEHAATIGEICEKLDGMPLAIELAAARTRTLSVDEILKHLDERFRLLTNAGRDGGSRHHTLAATIEWSYDLLTPEEQSLFLRLGVFRGSFSLSAAAAVCAEGGRCDEFHILDVLTSLSDKSLLNATIALATRYRLLDTIREFARGEAIERQAATIVAHQHAAYFTALAAQAYHEFDTQQPDGWLDRLEPDLDNFRAALEWTLTGDGDRRAGAQLGADIAPLFLRMLLLGEGLDWCARARAVDGIPPATAGRIDYVASMLYNNLGDYRQGLESAERALAAYRRSTDRRGLVRALSTVAQRYAQLQRFDEAREPAEEAIALARELREPRVLASVLRRCAYALPARDIERSRALFEEAHRAAESAHENEEACLTLEWWSLRESEVGNYARALELAKQALEKSTRDGAMYLESRIAGCALAMNDWSEAVPYAPRALERAVESRHALMTALNVTFCAALLLSDDAENAARTFGFGTARLRELDWQAEDETGAALQTIEARMKETLSGSAFETLRAEGQFLTLDDVVERIQSSLAVGGPHRATTVQNAGRSDARLR